MALYMRAYIPTSQGYWMRTKEITIMTNTTTNNNTTGFVLPTLINGLTFPVYAFAKPGKAAYAARLMGKPSHLSGVTYEEAKAFVLNNKFHHAIIKRMVEGTGRQTPVVEGAFLCFDITTSRDDYNHEMYSKVHPQLVEFITHIKEKGYTKVYANSRLVFNMAQHMGLDVHKMTVNEARAQGMMTYVLCKEYGRNNATFALNSLYSGCPVKMVLY